MAPPDSAEPRWLTAGLDHVWLPYAQMKTAARPLPVVASEGVRLTLADGRVLVDGIASWWTACHGYNHPHIAEALREQLARLPHVMFGGLAHEQAYKLATRLAALLPGDLERVFFTESGSVSVEVAMKMAVQYWMNRGVAGRTRILSFRGGYHGDTFATMAVCDPEEGMHAKFAGVLAPQVIGDLPRDGDSLAALRQLVEAHAHELAAILVEPRVQGAGGMVFHDDQVLRDLRQLADDFGLLLIFDEIFTGFGRTGAMFACAAAGVTPDIVTLSKALTGGTLPLAATAPKDGWCDAAEDPLYNQPVTLPYPVSAETLWRDDSVYDLVGILGHNDDPVRPGKGSAIFLHLAREGFPPTEGCVALALDDMLEVMRLAGPGSAIEIKR